MKIHATRRVTYKIDGDLLQEIAERYSIDESEVTPEIAADWLTTWVEEDFVNASGVVLTDDDGNRINY